MCEETLAFLPGAGCAVAFGCLQLGLMTKASRFEAPAMQKLFHRIATLFERRRADRMRKF